jgi:hypothetical protein
MNDLYRKPLTDYTEGRITQTGFVVDLLNTLNQDDLKRAPELLLSELLERVRDFVETYRPDKRVFRGPLPTPSAVKIARELLTKTVKST